MNLELPGTVAHLEGYGAGACIVGSIARAIGAARPDETSQLLGRQTRRAAKKVFMLDKWPRCGCRIEI